MGSRVRWVASCCAVGLAGCQLAPLGDPAGSDGPSGVAFRDAVFLDVDTIVAIATGFDGRSEQRFVRSDDGGESWTTLGRTALTGSSDEEVYALTPGASGSVWGVWSRTNSESIWRRGLTISDDRGATFRLIETTFLPICPRGLVGRSQADPLIFGDCGAQLYVYRRSGGAGPDEIEPWGVPVSDTESIVAGTSCGGAVFVATSPPDEPLRVTIQRSVDAGASWQVDLSTFGNPARLICGDDRVLWATIGDIALRRQGDGQWHGVEFITGARPTLNFTSLAATSELLFVSAYDAEGQPVVAVLTEDGIVDRATMPPGLSIRPALAVSPNGALFAFDLGVYRRDQFVWHPIWP